MGKPATPVYIRRQVLERDNFACMKCSRHSHLEIHHILPRYMGGQDVPGNLITLCTSCHIEAPDEPIKFFKWAAKRLPPDIERSLDLSKICINAIIFKFKLKSTIPVDNIQQSIDTFIDEMYRHIWKLWINQDINELGELMEKVTASHETPGDQH